MILLDTKICAAATRGDRNVSSKMLQYGGRIHIPWVVAAELKFGIEKYTRLGRDVEALQIRVNQLFAVSSGILMCSEEVLDHYANLRANLELTGTPIGANNLWIAAQAVAVDAMLMTDNLREFSRVPGIRAQNWLKRQRASP